ncbi:MAG: ATP-dependent helicase C-terminal domain-containing protein [Bacilli bacterium]
MVSAFSGTFSTLMKKLKICDGKIRPTFEILSPGGRAVQTTQNLEEFWKTSWIGVKKS